QPPAPPASNPACTTVPTAAQEREPAAPVPPSPAAAGQYAQWILQHEPGPTDLEQQRYTRFDRELRISLLLPAVPVAARLLDEVLASVAAQTYGNWELCALAGDDACHGMTDGTGRAV